MRARNIKPGFFKNELLGTADPLTAMLFAGLWLLADRDGRLEDRPLRIKAEIFPYRESLDINGMLTELVQLGFICRYEADGCAVIQVTNFRKHQTPHKTEKLSMLSAPPDNLLKNNTTSSGSVNKQVTNDGLTEALPPDSLNPDSPCSREGSATTDDTRSPFQKVYDAGIIVFPQLAAQSTSEIRSWIVNGLSPELDIIPEIKRLAPHGAKVKSWGYFTGPVTDANATRLRPLPQGQARRSAPPPDRKPTAGVLS